MSNYCRSFTSENTFDGIENFQDSVENIVEYERMDELFNILYSVQQIIQKS